MSKKKVEIKRDELQPQTIKIIKNHNFGFLFVFFAMAVFIAMVYFLPDIYAYYEKNIKKKKSSSVITNNVINNEVDNTTPEPTPEKEITYLVLNTNSKVSFDEVSFDNIKYENNTISITINSKTNSTLALNKRSYFMHVYDSNKSLLKTVYFIDYVNGSSNKNVNIDNAYYYNIEILGSNDYGFFVLEPNEYDQTFLTCTKNRTTLKYIFSDEKLAAIEDTITIKDPTDNDKSQYAGLKTTYENTTGITVSITDANPYLFVVNVDLKIYNGTLKTYYFSKDSDAREIKYKLEALDFSCR